MEMKSVQLGDRVLLKLRGDLDYSTREGFETELRRLMMRSRSLEVDCSEMKFVDSSGVASLLACCEDAAAAEITIRLTNMDPDVIYVLDLLGVREVLPVS